MTESDYDTVFPGGERGMYDFLGSWCPAGAWMLNMQKIFLAINYTFVIVFN